MSSLSITLIGIIIVFIALLILEYSIRLFSKFFTIREKLSRSKTADQEPVEASSPYDGSMKEIETANGSANDIIAEQEIAAVIAAAIQAAFSNREVKSNIRVRSFRRVSGDTPVWKSAAWFEHMQRARSGHK
jgi:Na+-transporting methylmalonyl-CoA/oxaloacetate decarboxylase gamma subunit